MKHYTVSVNWLPDFSRTRKWNKEKNSQQGGLRVTEENGSEQWLSGWLRPPALEAGIESIKALNKQLGLSVLNQFVQWLKLVSRGALKACTHPLLNLSQSPRPALCWLSVFHCKMAAPLGSWAELGGAGDWEVLGVGVSIYLHRVLPPLPVGESVGCLFLTERGWGSHHLNRAEASGEGNELDGNRHKTYSVS